MYSTTRHNFTSIDLLVFHKTTVLAQLPNTKIDLQVRSIYGENIADMA